MVEKLSNLDNVGYYFNQKLEPANLKEKFIFATFLIIAEKGADALTASELINKTESSKGALFHHFKTLDYLCLSCLIYFKYFVKNSIQVGQPQNLLDFLIALAKDESKRKHNASYFHLAHFFRDRAIRDLKFKQELISSQDIYCDQVSSLTKAYLSTNANPDKIKSIMMLYCDGLEKIFFHGLLYSNPEITQNRIQNLIESTQQQLIKL